MTRRCTGGKLLRRPVMEQARCGRIHPLARGADGACVLSRRRGWPRMTRGEDGCGYREESPRPGRPSRGARRPGPYRLLHQGLSAIPGGGGRGAHWYGDDRGPQHQSTAYDRWQHDGLHGRPAGRSRLHRGQRQCWLSGAKLHGADVRGSGDAYLRLVGSPAHGIRDQLPGAAVCRFFTETLCQCPDRRRGQPGWPGANCQHSEVRLHRLVTGKRPAGRLLHRYCLHPGSRRADAAGQAVGCTGHLLGQRRRPSGDHLDRFVAHDDHDDSREHDDHIE